MSITGEFVTTAQAAEILNLSASFLAKGRCAGFGPRFIRFGRSVRYAVADLRAWADENSRRSTTGDRR